MKLSVIFLSTLLVLPTPVVAQTSTVYGECYKNVEEYLPGYYTSDGTYIRGQVRTKREAVFCGNQGYGGGQQYQQTAQVPTKRCGARNTTFGALMGGGIAYFATKRRHYSSSIPVGAVLGAVAANANCY